MLLALLIDTKPLKIDIPARPKLRLHGPGDVNGRLHIQLRHPALHETELERNDTRHFYRAAEADFAISLTKMKVSDAELCAGNVHGQKDFRAARQVLDIAVPAVFRTPRYRSRALFPNFLFQVSCRGARVHVLWLRGLCDRAVEVRVCGYELCFARVPGREDGGGGRAAEDARMDEAGEADTWDVAGGTEYAFEVPDGFGAGEGVSYVLSFLRLGEVGRTA